jgi:hypothetical protein
MKSGKQERIMSQPVCLLASLATIFMAVPCFAQTAGPDWVKVGDAAWQARDSQGEVVYNDRLWIFGGWFDSYKPAPRDVWSSADGKNWDLVLNPNDKEPGWAHSDLAFSLTYGSKMWFMGGWFNGRLPGHSSSNAVWSSSDGATWEKATEHAGWTPRISAAVADFKGQMWVLGGLEDYYFGDDSNLKNDVWSSSDGKSWTLVTEHAEWSPRAYHQCAVLDGKLYVFGGGNYVPNYQAKHDVWVTEDGAHWEQCTESAPWVGRIWFSSAVYRDRMWVLGGAHKPGENWENLGDVWYCRTARTGRAQVERELEGASRALSLCAPRQAVDRRRAREAAEQRGVVAGVAGGVWEVGSVPPSAGIRSLLSAGETCGRPCGTVRRPAATLDGLDGGAEPRRLLPQS